MPETWNALRARLAGSAADGLHTVIVGKDELTALLDDLDALRPLAVLGARVLEAINAAPASIPAFDEFVDAALWQAVKDSPLTDAKGIYATPRIAAIVARLTRRGTNAD